MGLPFCASWVLSGVLSLFWMFVCSSTMLSFAVGKIWAFCAVSSLSVPSALDSVTAT